MIFLCILFFSLHCSDFLDSSGADGSGQHPKEEGGGEGEHQSIT